MATYDKEYIIRYVEGELSPEERRQFETDLREDAALEAEVSLYEELRSTLQQRLPPDERKEALMGTLRAMNKNYFKTPAEDAGRKVASGARRVPMVRWLAGMAAAASVILATVLLWPSGNGDALDRLGRMEMIGTAERGGNADSLLQQASVYFNREQFDKALPLLDRAVKEDSSSQLALFYRGVAAWHTGAAVAARKDLEQVFKSGSLLQYEAAFYIALIYAGEKDKAAALDWLKKIPGDAPVAEKAAALREQIK